MSCSLSATAVCAKPSHLSRVGCKLPVTEKDLGTWSWIIVVMVAGMTSLIEDDPSLGCNVWPLAQVETKAKAEIEDKKVALRHLVGNSYR